MVPTKRVRGCFDDVGGVGVVGVVGVVGDTDASDDHEKLFC